MSKLSHSTFWTVWRAKEGQISICPDTHPLPKTATLLGFHLLAQDAVELAREHRDSNHA